MAFGDTGEHGQAAARPVLAAKRFVIENVIVQLEIMVEKHVLGLNKTMALAINNPAPVKKNRMTIGLLQKPRHCIFTYIYIN